MSGAAGPLTETRDGVEVPARHYGENYTYQFIPAATLDVGHVVVGVPLASYVVRVTRANELMSVRVRYRDGSELDAPLWTSSHVRIATGLVTS